MMAIVYKTVFFLKIPNIMMKQIENKSRQTLIQIHVAFCVSPEYKQRWHSTSTNYNDWFT